MVLFLLFRAALRSSEVQRDPRRYLQTVQKVIAFMTLGIDMSKLFSEMIMVCVCVVCVVCVCLCVCACVRVCARKTKVSPQELLLSF